MSKFPEAMIVTAQPEASEAGACVLMRGGNAVDAAMAAALVQGVVDPQMGARPMARLVEQKLKKPIAKALVFGELKSQPGRVFKQMIEESPEARRLAWDRQRSGYDLVDDPSQIRDVERVSGSEQNDVRR